MEIKLVWPKKTEAKVFLKSETCNSFNEVYVGYNFFIALVYQH